jgi:hypothetical protein
LNKILAELLTSNFLLCDLKFQKENQNLILQSNQYSVVAQLLLAIDFNFTLRSRDHIMSLLVTITFQQLYVEKKIEFAQQLAQILQKVELAQPCIYSIC